MQYDRASLFRARPIDKHEILGHLLRFTLIIGYLTNTPCRHAAPQAHNRDSNIHIQNAEDAITDQPSGCPDPLGIAMSRRIADVSVSIKSNRSPVVRTQGTPGKTGDL